MRDLIILFIRRPVTVIMILAAIIIAAVFSVFSLPINKLPDISVPRVTVETLYPGMTANEIRSMVTIPLEDGFSPIKGLERMRSVSRDNRSLISIDFKWGIDPMTASVLVREAVDAIYPGLPEGAQKPFVTSGDTGSDVHAVIAVISHNGNNEFARKITEYELQTRLRRIDGVGSVIISGGQQKEEKILLDSDKLAALGLSPSEFTRLLGQETVDIPAGNAREGSMELVIVSSGKPESAASLSKINLPGAGGAFRVEDAGEIISSAARMESIFIFDGKSAAGIEVYRRPGFDPIRLSHEIKKTVVETSALFSRDVQIELITDSSSSLLNGLKGLLISAVLGTAAVVTVLALFIRRLRYSLLAALSIPVSIAAGIITLSITGKSLNSMSLSGIAMGIGLVSDISVIVLDLLNRKFGNRNSIPLAEEIGGSVFSIAGSSAASTLTTALVFIPIIMLPGLLGSLFGDIAISLVAGVAAGWFYAQFCLPSLYLKYFGSPIAANVSNKSVFTNGSHVKLRYLSLLADTLRHPCKLFAAAIALSFLGIFALFTRPVVFINPDEAEEVWVSVNYPPGTMLELIEESSINNLTLLSGLPSVKTVYGRAGAEEEDVNRRADIDYKKEEIIFRCVPEKGIRPGKTLNEITTAMKRYGEMPFIAYFPKNKAEKLLGLSADKTFVIKGKDRDELQENFYFTQDVFRKESITADFRPQGKRPELRLYPNREASAYLSISAAQTAEILYILNEGVIASRLEIQGRPLDVRVTGSLRQNTDMIRQLENIPLKTAQNKMVFLGSLVDFERREEEATLARLDRSDVIYSDVSSGLKDTSAFKKFVSQFNWFERADESAFGKYKNTLIVYVFLVLILLYLTMGAQFESFLLPIILMISIPFSLAGAGPALLIAGAKIDSGAVLGLTALFGLVVNNSLLLYEISEQKIFAGLSPMAAVFRGAGERCQAILITMATTIFALLPLIFSPLGNSQKSMAIAMLGGLTASTLLSLFAVPPVLIIYFNRKNGRELYNDK